MTSRRLTSSSSSASAAQSHRVILIAVAASISSLLLLALLLLFLFYFYLSHRRSPTLPLPSSSSPAANPLQLRRFSYRALRSATASFNPARSLGRGASAAVFRGVLSDGKSVAVKRLLYSPSSSPTRAAPCSDREFHNELNVLATLRPSPFVVSLLGYCLEGRRRRLLVYEYMPNGSLQEALFGSSSHLSWDRRFSIILDVAQALAFLHLECDPPVVHGDVKPSNVLLGFDFQAKISDFGLSRVNNETNLDPEFFSQNLGPSQELSKSQDLVSDSAQVDFALALHASSSIPFKSYAARLNPSSSPRGKEAAADPSSVQDENFSFEYSKELSVNSPIDDARTESNDQWGSHWWWKQEGSRELSSKDYVRDWIGSQICHSGNSDCDDGRRIHSEKCFDFRNSSRVENLEVGDDSIFSCAYNKNPENQGMKKGILPCAKKDRKVREWWKEEYFAEISRKGQRKKERRWSRTISSRDEEYASNTLNLDVEARRCPDVNADVIFSKRWKKKRSRSVGSEMFSGDLLSRELSSTTSMRGTVCYVAPECHGSDQLMEKADIYSFGVLILVIVSGRRPLHVLPSPVKLEKANLVSWCRQLAQTSNLLELVDEKMRGSYNKGQASLCINLALLCLQRTPVLRPDSGDIVKFLKGEMELPVVPYEFSPSPPAKNYTWSRRKSSMDME
ncbi:hypothetical protein Cni_G22274 [Canna indica]|uniref:Protein kinase domain-containing protein n=1 Tax=Canna indica TaxID=4628 RepID=A0AAQ3KS68_9LILI|nr:hypothetical protein Cni_G22274 [Canna indica]